MARGEAVTGEQLQRAVSLTAPTAVTLNVSCGASQASVPVWVVKASLGIGNDTLYLQGSGNYPNDHRRQINVKIEPNGAPGTLQLSAVTDPNNQASRIHFYNSVWSNSPIEDFDWQIDGEDAPYELWAEGQTISTQDHDQRISLSYTWGITITSSATATIALRPSSSDLSIHTHSTYETLDGAYIDDIASGVVGSGIYITVDLKLAQGDRLAKDINGNLLINGAKVRVIDDWQTDQSMTTIDDVPIDFTTQDGWEEYNDGWYDAICSPKDAVTSDGSRYFRYTIFWDTRVNSRTTNIAQNSPFESGYYGTGCNGMHSVKMLKTNGDALNSISFQSRKEDMTWDTAVEMQVNSAKVDVENVIVSYVSSSTGTSDYFKYSRDTQSPYHRPVINFTIEDKGNYGIHNRLYYYWIMINPTPNVSSEFVRNNPYGSSMYFLYGYTDHPGQISVEWDGKVYTYDSNNNAIESESDIAETSTYSYDVFVESDSCDDYSFDWISQKYPYCQSIDTDRFGFSYTNDSEFVATFKCKLADMAGSTEASNMNLILIDNELNEVSVIPKEMTCNDDTSTVMYRAKNMKGFWRVVVTGEDSCWDKYTRLHNPIHMLPGNGGEEALLQFVHFYDYNYANSSFSYLDADTDESVDRLQQICNSIKDGEKDGATGVNVMTLVHGFQSRGKETPYQDADNLRTQNLYLNKPLSQDNPEGKQKEWLAGNIVKGDQYGKEQFGHYPRFLMTSRGDNWVTGFSSFQTGFYNTKDLDYGMGGFSTTTKASQSRSSNNAVKYDYVFYVQYPTGLSVVKQDENTLQAVTVQFPVIDLSDIANALALKYRKLLPNSYFKNKKIDANEWKAANMKGRVDIVAHSMGGVVIRDMLRRDAVCNGIRNFATIDSPHGGLNWEKIGTVQAMSSNDARRAASINRVHNCNNENEHYNMVCDGMYNAFEQMMLGNDVKEMEQLLPTSKYISDLNRDLSSTTRKRNYNAVNLIQIGCKGARVSFWDKYYWLNKQSKDFDSAGLRHMSYVIDDEGKEDATDFFLPLSSQMNTLTVHDKYNKISTWTSTYGMNHDTIKQWPATWFYIDELME